MNNRKKIGAILRRHRETKELSLRDLGKSSGVNWRTIGSIETGRGRLDAEQLAQLTRVLGLQFSQEVFAASVKPRAKKARAR